MSSAPDFTASRENGHRRPKGYDIGWRPQAKTRTLLASVDEVLREYRDHLPLTVRQIFYRLVGAHGYEKSERAYERLANALVRARRARLIPFEVIRDDGVVSHTPDWHDSPEDFWDRVGENIRDYRRNRQVGQRQYLELWCEAAGMAEQLARVAEAFSVPVYSAGGFSSLTAVRMIARRALWENRPTVLLHVGDLDPSGESIFAAMAEDAAAFVEADRITHIERIEAVRVALTAEQVRAYDLPTSPPKGSDTRSRTWGGGTCQLEALPPDTLAEIVRDAILARIDWSRFERQFAAEEDDRLELLTALPSGEAA